MGTMPLDDKRKIKKKGSAPTQQALNRTLPRHRHAHTYTYTHTYAYIYTPLVNVGSTMYPITDATRGEGRRKRGDRGGAGADDGMGWFIVVVCQKRLFRDIKMSHRNGVRSRNNCRQLMVRCSVKRTQ